MSNICPPESSDREVSAGGGRGGEKQDGEGCFQTSTKKAIMSETAIKKKKIAS